jgi:hypothetical protein
MIHPVAAASGGGKPKLLDQVRKILRLRHYSLRTEEAYLAWMKRFILFHGKRHPRELDERDISTFLSSLAVEGAGRRFSSKPRHVKASLTCQAKQ